MFSARSASLARAIVPRAGVRTYAAAASAAVPKPPVALFGVDGTYASALVGYPGFQCRNTSPPDINVMGGTGVGVGVGVKGRAVLLMSNFFPDRSDEALAWLTLSGPPSTLQQ